MVFAIFSKKYLLIFIKYRILIFFSFPQIDEHPIWKWELRFSLHLSLKFCLFIKVSVLKIKLYNNNLIHKTHLLDELLGKIKCFFISKILIVGFTSFAFGTLDAELRANYIYFYMFCREYSTHFRLLLYIQLE